jgi:hypothetical protein
VWACIDTFTHRSAHRHAHTHTWKYTRSHPTFS